MANSGDDGVEAESSPLPDGESALGLSPTTAATRLLESVKYGVPPEPFLDRLATATDDDLAAIRTNRRTGLAFWLNVYNAATQLLLEERPKLFDSRLRFSVHPR